MASQWPYVHGHAMTSQWPCRGQSMTIHWPANRRGMASHWPCNDHALVIHPWPRRGKLMAMSRAAQWSCRAHPSMAIQ
eukprot:5125108-Lingulodinium_polyedra.AAC.1